MIGEPWDGWLAWLALTVAILAAFLVVYAALEEGRERRDARRRNQARPWDMGWQKPSGYFVKVYDPGSLLSVMMYREVSKSEAEFVVAMFSGSLIDPGEDRFP